MKWTCDKCQVSYHLETPTDVKQHRVFRCEQGDCRTAYTEKQFKHGKFVELYIPQAYQAAAGKV